MALPQIHLLAGFHSLMSGYGNLDAMKVVERLQVAESQLARHTPNISLQNWQDSSSHTALLDYWFHI
jgi:hypothetical protein